MFSYEFKINGADDPATPMRVNTCIDSQDANYKNIAVAGWTGFNYEVEEFGYKVDDNKPVFDGSITLTELADDDPVKYPNNGGANGVRFSMDMNAEKLWATTGNHKFAIVARLKDEAKTVMVVHEYPELYVAEVVEGGGQQPDDDPGEQGGATQPTNPGTADVSVIAIASLACVALAGIVIAKKIR